MHSTPDVYAPRAGIYSLTINHNGDWSGDAIIVWQCEKPDDPYDYDEFKMPCHQLIAGIMPNVINGNRIPGFVFARAVSVAVSAYVQQQMVEHAESIWPAGLTNDR